MADNGRGGGSLAGPIIVGAAVVAGAWVLGSKLAVPLDKMAPGVVKVGDAAEAYTPAVVEVGKAMTTIARNVDAGWPMPGRRAPPSCLRCGAGDGTRG